MIRIEYFKDLFLFFVVGMLDADGVVKIINLNIKMIKMIKTIW